MSRSALPFHTVETFLITARHLNLTHAAQELCLTQGSQPTDRRAGKLVRLPAI